MRPSTGRMPSPPGDRRRPARSPSGEREPVTEIEAREGTGPLEAILQEHEQLQQRLADPSVHADQLLARRLNRRYAELDRVVGAHRDLQALREDLEAARELAPEAPEFAAEAEQLRTFCVRADAVTSGSAVTPAVVRREALEDAVWGDHVPDSDALRSHIHQLRQVLDKPFAKPLLHTVHGLGFRLAEDCDAR